jgi:hypothetical protein
MIWAKRRFAYADYSPYFDRMEKLVMANPTLYRQFIMVSTKTDGPGESMYYVGVPNETFMAMFDGFERVSEAGLPKIIDTLHIADAATDEFTSRFKFKEGYQ